MKLRSYNFLHRDFCYSGDIAEARHMVDWLWSQPKDSVDWSLLPVGNVMVITIKADTHEAEEAIKQRFGFGGAA